MAEPTRVTIAGARQGYNCRLTISRYGSFVCRVVSIAPSVKIIASDESAGRRRAFYPFVTSGSSFEMAVVHAGWSEREAFNRWVRGYMTRIADNARIGGVVLVEVPARRFSRTAIPEGVLNYGEDVATPTYTSALSFVGASDAVSAIGQSSVGGDSYVQTPRQDYKTSRYFYPSGSQVSGAASLEGTIFDRTPNVAPARTSGTLPNVGDLMPGADDYYADQPLAPFGIFRASP
jgi:hypothetical protein